MINDTAVKNAKERQVISKETLIDMYINRQMSDKQIAKELGCGGTTVNRYRKKYGIDSIDRNLELHQKITKELLIDLYVNKQMTDEQIAKKLNCGRKTISYYRIKYGIATIDKNLDKVLTKEILIDMYINKQMSETQIAKELGCCTTTVGSYCKKYGIATTDRHLELCQKITEEVLVDMYINKQMTDTQIAKELGCNEATVRKYRKRYGVDNIDRHIEIHRKITKEVLVDMYINRHMSDTQIAKELGCDGTTIGNYRKKYGIETVVRTSDLSKKITKEILVDMYINKQMTDTQIAKELGCSSKIIGKYRKKYDIKNIKQNLDQILTKEILADMCINKQMTNEQIAKEFACSESTVGKYRKKHGIDTLDKHLELCQKITEEVLVDMYINRHMSDTQIGKELGCDGATIGNYRKKYGIDTLDKHLELRQKLTKENLVDMYINKQMTDKQITKELGCSESTIRKFRKKHGIETINRKLEICQKLNKESLVDMYINKQMTDTQIAKELGCNEATVRKYRKKHGIPNIPRTVSVQQQDVYNKLYALFMDASIAAPEIIMNDRKTIAPFEIDIFIPDYNFGIEFNGGFWHSEVKHNKTYHYDKSLLAKEKGIFIYHIFSYEWENNNKRKKIMNQIKNLLGLNTNKIYARKCEIREVDITEKRDFLNENHVQGNDRAAIKLGLYYNDELVSLMTFAKPRFSKKYTWELSRFCSKANYNIIGGASKLFKYFINNHMTLNETIVSYSDIAKTKGNLYANLGFTFLHVSDPNYIWWKNDNEYKTRYQCQMKNEVDIMTAQDYHRIYDCGNKTWVYNKL